MTEPENFDDELFADLYNDEDPSGKTEAAAPAPVASTTAAPPVQNASNAFEDTAQEDDQIGGDTFMDNDEIEEDDDEVDFNLGNGTTSMVNHYDDMPAIPASASPPASAPIKGPNAKEDG